MTAKGILTTMTLALAMTSHAALAAAPGAAMTYHYATIDGIKVFYREAGDPKKPTILLLHGYPSSSHMFRELIPLLSADFHLVAPDYPGFGYSDAPGPGTFEATFAHLTQVMEHFVQTLGLKHFSIYMQDFGGPVGFRLAVLHPEWIDRLIIQNANAYDEGLAPSVREGNARRAAKPASEGELKFELGPDLAHLLYQKGARAPEAMNPDAWSLDEWAMNQPGHKRIAAALLNDYNTNILSYPAWQAYLRTHKPRTLIVWGKGDPIFLVPGAEAYKRDVPKATLQLLDTSHFALEEDSRAIAQAVRAFFKS